MQSNSYPRIHQAIVFVLLAVFLDLIAGLILSAINAEGVVDELITAVFTIANYFILFWYFRRRSGMGVGSTFVLNRNVVFTLPAVVLTILGAIILMSEVGNLVLILLPVPQWLDEIMSDVVLGSGFSLMAVLVVAVIPAVFEEIMFRGLIMKGLLRNHSAGVSIVVSALLFGFIHLNPWQFIGASLFGLLLGWIAYKTGSIVPTIIAHFINNFLLLVASLATDIISIPGFNAGVGTEVSFQPWWFDLIGLALFATGVIVLWWMFRQLHPAQSLSASALQ